MKSLFSFLFMFVLLAAAECNFTTSERKTSKKPSENKPNIENPNPSVVNNFDFTELFANYVQQSNFIQNVLSSNESYEQKKKKMDDFRIGLIKEAIKQNKLKEYLFKILTERDEIHFIHDSFDQNVPIFFGYQALDGTTGSFYYMGVKYLTSLEDIKEFINKAGLKLPIDPQQGLSLGLPKDKLRIINNLNVSSDQIVDLFYGPNN